LIFPGNQVNLVLNCNGSLPCLDSPGGGSGDKIYTSANNFTPSGGIISLSTVANRTSGTQTSATWIATAEGNGSNRNRIQLASGTQWRLGGSVGVINPTVSNAAWHAVQGVVNTNPGTSVVNVDGSESTSTSITYDTSVEKPVVKLSGAFSTLTTQWAESGFQNATGWSSGIRTAMCHSQYVYWSTSTSC